MGGCSSVRRQSCSPPELGASSLPRGPGTHPACSHCTHGHATYLHCTHMQGTLTARTYSAFSMYSPDACTWHTYKCTAHPHVLCTRAAHAHGAHVHALHVLTAHSCCAVPLRTRTLYAHSKSTPNAPTYSSAAHTHTPHSHIGPAHAHLLQPPHMTPILVCSPRAHKGHMHLLHTDSAGRPHAHTGHMPAHTAGIHLCSVSQLL